MDERLNAPLSDVIFAPASQASPRERIREGNRSFLESYRTEARLISEIDQVSRYDKHLNAERFANQRRYGEQLAKSLRQMQKSGLVDRKLDPIFAGHAVGAMVTRVADMWFVQGVLEADFDTALDQLSRLVANALGLPDDDANRRRG
jgi:hypothetical protein